MLFDNKLWKLLPFDHGLCSIDCVVVVWCETLIRSNRAITTITYVVMAIDRFEYHPMYLFEILSGTNKR